MLTRPVVVPGGQGLGCRAGVGEWSASFEVGGRSLEIGDVEELVVWQSKHFLARRLCHTQPSIKLNPQSKPQPNPQPNSCCPTVKTPSCPPAASDTKRRILKHRHLLQLVKTWELIPFAPFSAGK